MSDGTWAEGVARFEAVQRERHHDHMAIPAEVLRQSNRCLNCRRTILIMINRGMGWCSEQCRKALAAGWEAEAAVGATHALAVLDGLRAAVPDRYTERGLLAEPDELRATKECPLCGEPLGQFPGCPSCDQENGIYL